MAFAIRFEGLVCHLDDNGQQTAIFIEGPDNPAHELRLVAQDPADVLAATFLEDKLFVEGQGRSFLIAGESLTLTGAADQAVPATAAFIASVPRLSAFTSCADIRPEVKQRQITHGAIGYLAHPRGELSVDEFFEKKAEFREGPNVVTRCVAKTVRLTLQPAAATVEITGQNGMIRLRPHATIEVYNSTPHPVPGVLNQHFHHYIHLFDHAACTLSATPRESVELCASAGTNKAGGTECTNTHLP